MKVFIIGQKWFGAETYALARRLGHEVAGVCAPKRDGPERADRLWDAAILDGVPIAPLGAAGRLHAGLLPAGLDLVVAAHAHVYVPAEVRAAARLGAIGYHPSLLPRHRGRDAVRWALHMREPFTGGTVYRLTDRADGGPILAQGWCHVRPTDTPAELWRRELAPLGLRLLERVLADPERAIAAAVPQDESLATWEPSLDRAPLSAERRSAGPNAAPQG